VELENKALVLDLLEWLASKARSYAEVMDAWRTSCPRLPIWEDAIDLGFVVNRHAGSGLVVEVTEAGRTFLAAERPVCSESR
jgi:hypothetical protein